MDRDRFDATALQRLRAMGGAALVQEITSLALQNIDTRLEEARAGSMSRDLQRVRNALHSIVSSAGNVGGTELQRLVEAGLQRLRAGEPVDVPRLLERLETARVALVAALEREAHDADA